ncbi:unnamed protein product [Parajaminaea phylloscopi]
MIASALATSTRSLRTSRSLGALRAAANAQQPANSAPALPPLPLPAHVRSLVSSVLLSRDAYDKKNVTQLKDECKQRGLTVTGRRADIVARLLNDDAKQNGSGLRQEEPSQKARSTHRRTNSSLASLRGKDASPAASSSSKGSKSSAPSASTSPASPASAPGSSSSPAPTAPASSPATHTPTAGKKASISHPESIKPGQIAHAGQQQSPNQGGTIATPQKLDPDSNPPGVPPQKEPSPPTTFRVEVPYEQVAPPRGPEIPIVTMYTRREPTQEPAVERGPRVVTASANADVSHALGTAGLEAQSQAPSPSAASQALASASKSLRSDLGLNSSSSVQVSEILRATGAGSVGSQVSQVTNALVQDASLAFAGLSQAAKDAAAAGEPTSPGAPGFGSSTGNTKRPLNADEKRGLYILGGILVTGFAVGGVSQKVSKAGQAHAHS